MCRWQADVSSLCGHQYRETYLSRCPASLVDAGRYPNGRENTVGTPDEPVDGDTAQDPDFLCLLSRMDCQRNYDLTERWICCGCYHNNESTKNCASCSHEFCLRRCMVQQPVTNGGRVNYNWLPAGYGEEQGASDEGSGDTTISAAGTNGANGANGTNGH